MVGPHRWGGGGRRLGSLYRILELRGSAGVGCRSVGTDTQACVPTDTHTHPALRSHSACGAQPGRLQEAASQSRRSSRSRRIRPSSLQLLWQSAEGSSGPVPLRPLFRLDRIPEERAKDPCASISGRVYKHRPLLILGHRSGKATSSSGEGSPVPAQVLQQRPGKNSLWQACGCAHSSDLGSPSKERPWSVRTRPWNVCCMSAAWPRLCICAEVIMAGLVWCL